MRPHISILSVFRIRRLIAPLQVDCEHDGQQTLPEMVVRRDGAQCFDECQLIRTATMTHII